MSRSFVVIDTLRFLANGWLANEADQKWCLEAADLIEGHDFEAGFACPLCQEVICDDGCPLEPLRQNA